MGAFCTRTICNVEKGDENYNKLLQRNNMEKKKPEFEAVPSREKVPENDEMPMTPSPEPKPAYTHSIPSPQITMSTIPTPPTGDTSSPTKSIHHSQVPTPSFQEIQAAVDNMSMMFTPKDTGGFETNFEQNAEKEQTPTLPTMALDVSNLKLANPFGSPAVSAGSNDNVSIFPATNHMIKNDNNNNNNNNDKINTSVSPPVNRMTRIESKQNMSAIIESPTRTPIGVDIDTPNGGDTPKVDIAPAAPIPIDIKPANIEPTIANIFGDNTQSDTMIIHGDLNEDTTKKLTLQLEGSSDQMDQTNVVFSPPNISDNNNNNNNNNDILQPNVVSLEQVEVVSDIAIIENKVDENIENQSKEDQIIKNEIKEDDNKEDQNKFKEIDQDVMPQSENLLIQKISQMESVESNENDNDDINREENDDNHINDDQVDGDKVDGDKVDDDKVDGDTVNDDTVNGDEIDGDEMVGDDDMNDEKNEEKSVVINENENDDDNEDIVESNNDKEQNISQMESVDDNENTVNDKETETRTVEMNEDAENEENDVNDVKPAQVQFKVEIEYAEEEQQEEQIKDNDKTLSATNSNQSDKKKSVGNQMSDPWKSDYETSDLESFDGSSGKGEEDQADDNDNDNNNDNDNDKGKKRRASKSESRPQQLLQLNYYETTLNDESTEEEESPEPGNHSKLYREDSRWKWQKKEIKKHEKQMKQELRKLQRAQDLAEMNDMMTYYRQQSEQMQ